MTATDRPAAIVAGIDRREAWSGFARVFGEPAGMGSKRIGRAKFGAPIILDASDAKLRSWQREMKSAMHDCAPPAPLDVAVSVNISVYLARPRSQFGSGRNAGVLKPGAPSFPPSGRDLDKIARACLDCAKGAGWVRDDARVASLLVQRFYTQGAERTEVRCLAL